MLQFWPETSNDVETFPYGKKFDSKTAETSVTTMPCYLFLTSFYYGLLFLRL